MTEPSTVTPTVMPVSCPVTPTVMTVSCPVTTSMTVQSTVTPAETEGTDLSAMPDIWEDLARTETLLQLMKELTKIKVGFADVEEFNLGLRGNLKNLNSENIDGVKDNKVVKVAMEIKMRDEQVTKRKLIRARNKAREELAKILGKNTKRYRTRIRGFQERARKAKAEAKEKYKNKLEHLKFK